ncbi:MAG: hypothetical protein KDD45_10915, partial [Bdellovibrionales bacterium]|nr:hypothetical protein [Bdellovibrionales bacterium]
MRLLNREQSSELDQKAVSDYNFSFHQLISQAAASLLNSFSLVFNKEEKNQKVIFLVGPGNNGQDAFHMKKLFEVKFPTVKVELYQYEELDLFLSSPRPERAVVIDGLFGVGLNRKLSDIVIKVIHTINQNSEIFKVVSIDVPSGLDSNTGLIYGACIKADFTLACELPKVGCFLNHGPYYSGKIKSVSIGFPEKLVKDTAKNFRLIQRKIAQRIFPKRSVLTNKSKQGHLLIIAGSLKMPGALRLCSLAAARMGVGYVT